MVGEQGVAKRWQVTPRDEEWLAWIGRWKGATAPQVAAEFAGRGQSAPLKVVERRLRGLRELGLVTYQRIIHDLPGAWSLTRHGMNKAGIGGRPLTPTVATFRHDLEVIELARKLAVEKPSHELVTEREIMRLEAPGRKPVTDPKYCVRDISTGSKVRWQFPDLVSVTPTGQVWAHELEASKKDSPRLRRLMLAYIYADHITGVRYYTVPAVTEAVRAAAAAANDAAAELGRPRKISVQPWRDIGPRPATSTSLGRALPPEDAYSE